MLQTTAKTLKKRYASIRMSSRVSAFMSHAPTSVVVIRISSRVTEPDPKTMQPGAARPMSRAKRQNDGQVNGRAKIVRYDVLMTVPA